jgi:hypothetical protein
MDTSISALSAPFENVSATSQQRAQVHLLKRQGESPSEIAASLGIATATVDGILGITAANAAAVPNAALTPAPTQSDLARPGISIFA